MSTCKPVGELTGSYPAIRLTTRGKILAIKVKPSATVEDKDTTHLHWLAAQLGGTLLDAIVINTGPNAYRRPDGIGVVPLGILGS